MIGNKRLAGNNYRIELLLLCLLLMVIVLLVRSHYIAQNRTETLTGYVDILESQSEKLLENNNALRKELVQQQYLTQEYQIKLNICMEQTEDLTFQLQEGDTQRSSVQRIVLSDLQITSDYTTLHIEDVTLGIISPTGSMEPLLQEDNLVLEQTPTQPGELFPGDIIIYELQRGPETIRVIHRIIDTGYDEQGWYAITKGDSNDEPDSEPVRFEQIKGVVVGIIY